MGENSGSNGNYGVVLNVKEGDVNHDSPTVASKTNNEAGSCDSCISLTFMQKVTLLLYLSFLLYFVPDLNNI